jgi:DNA-binding CsgD family transcriptional regulator
MAGASPLPEGGARSELDAIMPLPGTERALARCRSMPALFVETVSDWADRLSRTPTGERWTLSTHLSQEVSASALIVGELDLETSAPVWLRSSMKPDWLAEYVDRGYARVDPILAHALSRSGPLSLEPGQLSRATAPDALSYDLDHGLARAGYRRLVAETTAGGAPGNRRVVALALTPEASEDLHAATLRRLLMAIVATALPDPTDPDAPGLVPIGPARSLTRRERDVLSQLARGHRNEAIAHRLGVAEITVRKHVAAARRKLGAATREQAVALALRAGVLRI